jgi:anthranilate phosphoribosyltransferase
MITAALQRLLQHRDLTRHQAYAVLRSILAGQATDAQIGALLMALAMKGETVEELVGFASAMRAEVTSIHAAAPGTDGESAVPGFVDASGTERDALLSEDAVWDDQPLPDDLILAPVLLPIANGRTVIDTCGTGGDASGTFNISTATAFTVSGAGLPVAKHGNRSISSRCGSADVMEAMGVRLELPPKRLGECLEKVGIAFLFAPALHPAMRFVQPARRQLRVRTIFNLLGPLTNPAGAQAQVVGVYSALLAEKLAEVLLRLGARRAFVVHGDDGLDELTTTAMTTVAEVREGKVHTYRLDARELGLPRSSMAELAGGDVCDNVRAVESVLRGEPGPRRDIVVLNAAAALVAGGVAADLPEGVARAMESLDSGAAWNRLQHLIEFTQSVTV